MRRTAGTLLTVLTLVIASALAATAAEKTKPSQAESSDIKKIAPRSSQQEPKVEKPAARFTPSEKLRADDAISFPVDI